MEDNTIVHKRKLVSVTKKIKDKRKKPNHESLSIIQQVVNNKEKLLKKYENAGALFSNKQYDAALLMYNEIDTPRLPLRQQLNVFYHKGIIFMDKAEELNADLQKNNHILSKEYIDQMVIERQECIAKAIEMHEKIISLNNYKNFYPRACVYYCLGSLYYAKKDEKRSEENRLKALSVIDALDKEYNSMLDNYQRGYDILHAIVKKDTQSDNISKDKEFINNFLNNIEKQRGEKITSLENFCKKISENKKELLDQKALIVELELKTLLDLCEMSFERAKKNKDDSDYANCYKYAVRLTASNSDYYRFIGYSCLTLGNNHDLDDKHSFIILVDEGIKAYTRLKEKDFQISKEEMDIFKIHYDRLVNIRDLFA